MQPQDDATSVDAPRSVAELDTRLAAARARSDWADVDQLLAPLVASAADGNAAALDTLLRLIHRHRLAHAAVRKLLIDEHDADDAVQTTLLAVARSITTFERRSRFTTWLYRIAEREALQVLRRNQRAAKPADGMEDLTEEVARMSSMIVDRAMVAKIVAGLPEKFRAPLLMCDVEGLEYADIAERLDVPLNTVRSRIRRARHAVASQVLAAQGIDAPVDPTDDPTDDAADDNTD